MNFYKFYKKHIRKSIFENHLLFAIVMKVFAWVLYVYLYLVLITSKIECNIQIADIKTLKTDRFIFGVWHGRLLLPFFLHYKKITNPPTVLSSYSKNSQLISGVSKLFGAKTIYASTKKTTTKDLFTLIKELKTPKINLVVTPDGSIGPRMQCNSSICILSTTSKTPILPLSFSAKRGKFLNSWDRIFIPYPFNRITVISSPLIYCHSEDANIKVDLEKKRLEIEKALNNLTWEVDAKYKHTKIEPALLNRKKQPVQTL